MQQITVTVILAGIISNIAVAADTSTSASNGIHSRVEKVFSNSSKDRLEALQWMRERGKIDVIAPLIYALRYIPNNRDEIAATLSDLTSVDYGKDWFQWRLWQQKHPEARPYNGFDIFLSRLFAHIDPEFQIFIYPDVKHSIRLEEIVWGGVKKDGIPALTNPRFIKAAKADYLSDDEPVFGVEINGDVRAYPYRIMDWHEMFNDVIGGMPVSLAYCTLCASGILFDTRVDGFDKPLVFGSSGFLYRSNKLMYDQQTHSLWNQFTGRPVVGELTNSNIQLKVLPVVTTTWEKWRTQHPDTKVLSVKTGFDRDYSAGKPYGTYFSSPDLMFPAATPDNRLQAKEQVFGLRITGSEKAWPLTAFKGKQVINDRVGAIPIVLIGDADSRMVRAYRSGGRTFSKIGDDLNTVESAAGIWAVSEAALLGPDGENLPRLPGHLAYWFAWSGYLKDAEFSNPAQ